MEDFQKFKENSKTSYLAESFEILVKEEAELLNLAKDPEMKELAEKDLKDLALRKDVLMNQMQSIKIQNKWLSFSCNATMR